MLFIWNAVGYFKFFADFLCVEHMHTNMTLETEL